MLIKSYSKEIGTLLFPFEVKKRERWTSSVGADYSRASQSRQWISKLPTHKINEVLDSHFVDGTPFGTRMEYLVEAIELSADDILVEAHLLEEAILAEGFTSYHIAVDPGSHGLPYTIKHVGDPDRIT